MANSTNWDQELYGNSSNPTGQSSSGGGFLSSILNAVAGPVMNAIKNQQTQVSQLPNAQGNLPQAVSNAASATGDLFKNTLGNPQVDEYAGALAAAPAIGPAAVGALGPVLGGAATGGVAGELGGMSSGQSPVGALPMAAGGAVTGGALGAVSKVLPFLTQSTINNKYSQVMQDAASAGKTANWESDIQKPILNDLEKNYKYDPRFVKEVKGVLNSRTPAATMVETPYSGQASAGETVETPQLQGAELTPQDLHTFRMSLDNSIPQNAWGNPNVRDLGIKANQYVRGQVSATLHSLVPETKNLDKVNSLYYNPFFKGINLGGLNLKYPASMTGFPSAAANVIGGDLLLKKIGVLR